MADGKANWEDCFEVAAVTDVGMRRANNQDAHTVVIAKSQERWVRRGHLLMVADGMGAHAAGELASKLAVDGVPHHYQKYLELSAPEALQRAIIETNAEVHRRGQANPDFHNMGTTASVLVLVPQGAVVAHVGDSRIYRMRNETLEQITFDHSLVWEMRAAGQLPEDSDLATAIPKNVITRSLGPNANLQVDVEGPYPLQVGDTFMLCSDGLTGEVPDEELGPILANLSPAEAAQVLVDLANLRGGPDNITVIVARITGDEVLQDAPAEPITIGGDRTPPRVHPALWITMGVCLLVALILALTSNLIPAAAAGVGGLIALAVSLWQAFGQRSRGISLSNGRRLGNGPHMTLDCPANEPFMHKLASVVQELRDAAMDRNWTIDWATFDGLCRDGQQAGAAGQYPQAIREYARAVSFMMQQLRNKDAQEASDSAIDY